MFGRMGSRTTSKVPWPRSHGTMGTTPAGHPGMAELPSSTSSSQRGMAGAQPCEEPGDLPVGQVCMWSLGSTACQ